MLMTIHVVADDAIEKIIALLRVSKRLNDAYSEQKKSNVNEIASEVQAKEVLGLMKPTSHPKLR